MRRGAERFLRGVGTNAISGNEDSSRAKHAKSDARFASRGPHGKTLRALALTLTSPGPATAFAPAFPTIGKSTSQTGLKYASHPVLVKPAALKPHQPQGRSGSASMIPDIPFNDGPLVYSDLHAILALPTLTLLALYPSLQDAKQVQKTAAYTFIGFIVVVGVFQSFLWDSYGASQGFWEFNPAKCTLRENFPLPLEEILWLFHHVTKTALYQLKAFELIPRQSSRGLPSTELRAGVSLALVAASAFGVWALGAFGPTDDTVKCIGLVAAFFAPVWLLIWQVGSQFVLRHADRITWGWLLPGITTVLIDCLGQQQGVWRFPNEFLSGIGLGYLKLDIVLVYMVSTFAVTGTGAVILAATEELLARRAAQGAPVPTLIDVWQYIFSAARSGSLQLAGEGEAFSYDGIDRNEADVSTDASRAEK